jgi:hypothetical protein
MTTFLVNIWAYDHHAKFEVSCEDSPTSLENSILDKLGEKSIVWEYLGISYDNKINRITYEEVINGGYNATSGDPLHTEEGTRSSMGARAS